MTDPGIDASMTRWTAFQNDSTWIAACKFSRDLSTAGSMIIRRFRLVLDVRFIHAVLQVHRFGYAAGGRVGFLKR